ncbi:MAG TPA: hypothetical protein PK011_10800, partial [Marinagarivorans sp.]|nr:hypothetical protein [Marinagarivorans sp.]
TGNQPPAATPGRANYALPPMFTLFNDSLASGLQYGSYNPDNTISISEANETGRGKIIKIAKTGSNGNVFLNLIDGPVDLRSFAEGGEIRFDLKINSLAAGSKLLIKLDSGWPNTSDIAVNFPATGQWAEVRISIPQLIARGNSLAAGAANLASVTNLLVIEPTGDMDLSLDNIQLVKP